MPSIGTPASLFYLLVGSWPLAKGVRFSEHSARLAESGEEENWGIFSNIVVESDFEGAEFWDRNCPHHYVSQGDFIEGDEVYSASYNECSGVSDLVYYSVHASRFAKGAGRGGSWKNDKELTEIMKRLKKSSSEYATAAAYSGVGYFSMDRGHQAPVASYNADDKTATATNVPTNLSPQSCYLNQRSWKFLEMDMRLKADSTAESNIDFLDMLTGPLYELPAAMLQNKRGAKLWEELLETGGEVNTQEPWCSKENDEGFESKPVFAKKSGKRHPAKVTCQVRNATKLEHASVDPNQLKISFQADEKKFPLRAPLGYFKLMVMQSGSRFGRRTCAYVMDQVGQCLLVSLELLSKMAHLDLEDTDFAENGGTTVQDKDSDTEFNAYVNPWFCIPPGGTLRKNNACYLASNAATNITMEMMNHYWAIRGE